MVDVFVLTGATAYEGEELVGVYASLEDAQAAAESYATRAEADDRSEGYCVVADWYNVYQVELGRAGRWHSHQDVIWQLGVDGEGD